MTPSPHTLAARHQAAVLDAEARSLAGICVSYGILTRNGLVELSRARHWSRGKFPLALARAIDRGWVRDLGYGLYGPPAASRAPTRARDPRPTRDSWDS